MTEMPGSHLEGNISRAPCGFRPAWVNVHEKRVPAMVPLVVGRQVGRAGERDSGSSKAGGLTRALRSPEPGFSPTVPGPTSATTHSPWESHPKKNPIATRSTPALNMNLGSKVYETRPIGHRAERVGDRNEPRSSLLLPSSSTFSEPWPTLAAPFCGHSELPPDTS